MTGQDQPATRSTIIGIALASALVPLNSTMVAVALPKLARAFGIGRGRAGVLITVYLAAMLIGQPLAGRVSDAVGNKRLVVISLVGFAACSTGAALSPSFAWLVTARGLQAVFASALAPSVQSMLRSVTPPSHQGHTFGILGSVIGVGAAAGPIVGGALSGAFGWKAIFLANLPVVAVTLLVLSRVKIPRTDARKTAIRRADCDASAVDMGARGKDLRAPSYLAALATQALSNLAQYSLLLIAPIVLDQRNWGPGATGLALSALTVGLIVMGPSGGRSGDLSGRRRAVTTGLSVAALGTATLLPFGIDISPTVLIVALAMFGIGLGYASPSITAAGLEAVSQERTGSAAGLLSASRYVGSIVASLLLSLYVADDGTGGRRMFVAAALALIFAIAASRRLSGRAVSGAPAVLA